MQKIEKNLDNPRLLDLKELLSGRETKAVFCRSFFLDYACGDVACNGDTVVEGSVSDYSGVLQFQADFSVPYRAECARCLKEVHKTISFSLDRPVTRTEREEEECVCATEDVIDLEELARVGVEEHLPFKHLCFDDCKGLCPLCGTDLNEAPCSCKPAPDPRLAGLTEFFNE